ncbi:(S)-ureidoglycine aminohydrolase [Lachnotalea glycerini]|uniref:(S)-ureidoglycine aminohydrolase n=1 Tax=Lachnotalea glycerini TaxID=1763509 RepID=A0A255I1R8_9FIRM|nr:(S)-ureidoglycine aminohydrolase [Lachnotalea glycerini]PXV93820.1 (S)-ureidoglycine aminohydrolase [Lachnotalea glycerini]RDY30939.1 (S)-ureidoglycine aminohydrolase [Lachnotalea glycerini]
MGYMNNQIGYREGLLETRSIVKKGNYVLLEPDGLVKNSIPGYENCIITIMSSPAMGASFVDYLITVDKDGKNLKGIGGKELEVFLYVLEGEISVWNTDENAVLTKEGYIFSPAGKELCFENKSSAPAKIYLYKRKYEKIEGYSANAVIGNAKDLPWIPYEGMENCYVKDFLPAANNFGFDMNMHILKFHLGASHGYIETHVQEHGMYFLSGKGMYYVDGDWIPTQKGDYMFLDAYCPQACYAVGKDEDFTYIYSKDCNRDVQL